MSQDIGMQADSNTPPRRVTDFVALGSWPPVVSYVACAAQFEGPSPEFRVDYFSSFSNSSTRVN